METILKATGLSELEFKKLYLDSMNLMIATGCTETEARGIVIGVLRKSLGIIVGFLSKKSNFNITINLKKNENNSD